MLLVSENQVEFQATFKTMSASSGTNLSLSGTGAAPPAQGHEETMFGTMAGVIGNMLEWYDFALFGFFSGTWFLPMRL